MTQPQTAAEKAAQLVGGERQQAHGDPKILFDTIAQFWSIFLHRRRFHRTAYLAGSDVAAMMALFKLARTMHGGETEDSWTDLAGYSSIAHYLTCMEEAEFGSEDRT